MSTERGGWYDSFTREPRYFVEKKAGGKRPATLADARKAETWVPGVTSILNVLHKQALVDWKVRTAVEAALTTPRIEGEDLDAFMKRCLYQEATAESEAAKDRGTEIHDALQALAQGKEIIEIDEPRRIVFQEPLEPWIMPAWNHVKAFELRVRATERVVIGKGYGGRLDLELEGMSYTHLVDFKTSKKIPDKGSWTEHRLQLAAYAKTFGNSYPIVTTANLYISTTEQGRFAYFDNGDWTRDYECFEHLVKVWQHLNNYIPQQ